MLSPHLNPLTTASDHCLTSPYSNTAQSNIKVVRKKKVIKEMNGGQFGEYAC